ncbi:MAG TPA: DMT family transporter [Jatrophihabitans sp.]|nr:DMT family transporter [Jatrophihabitans sp.]
MKALRKDWLAPAFVLVWSSGYVAGALATQVIAPLAVTMWRFLVAASVLAGIAAVRRERWPRGRELAALLGIGVPLFAVQFGALYTAMADGLPAGTTSLIACSSPLAVAAISALARWERLRPAQWLGVGLGVLGVLITLADRVGRPPNLASLLWALLGLAGLAGGTALQARARSTAGPAAIASVEVAAGLAVLAIWAPLTDRLTIPLTAHAICCFLWLSLIAGVGAPMLLFALIRRRGATRASSYLFVVPAVTAFAAWPLLGTPVGPLTVAGLVVVGVALLLTSGRFGVRRDAVVAPHRSADRPAAAVPG